MNGFNVLLASGGRRPYLTTWFQEAIRENGLEGHVVVADLDPIAPARAFADVFVQAPRLDDDGYESWLRRILVQQQISVAISINDFELSEWSRYEPGDTVLAPLVRLDAPAQTVMEDKLAMSSALTAAGVRAPVTLLASQLTVGDIPENIVVKGRFGSGSRGLGLSHRRGLHKALSRAAEEVTDRSGMLASTYDEAQSLIVVQPEIQGQEYGLDIIADLRGNFNTVLARKKLAMRGGETDRAMTVDPAPFMEVGRQISRALRHRGSIDTDVIQDKDGEIWVIDVNPRFGGGYPFSHVAGANIPAAYVAWSAGRPVDVSWLCADTGVTGAKYVDIAATQREALP